MGQPELLGNDVSLDVTVKGAPARASYGMGADFANPRRGEKPTREQVERAFAMVYDGSARYRMMIEPEWMVEYQQYHGNTDDPKLSAWQSQAHIPKAAEAVDTIVSRVSQVMFGTDEWFGGDPESSAQDQKVEFARRCLKWKLDQKNAAAIDGLSQAVKNAVICGNGPVKIHYARTIRRAFESRFVAGEPITFLGRQIDSGGEFKPGFVDRAVNELRVEPLVPTDCWLDPTGQNRFMIVKHKRMLSDLWELARPVYGEDGKTIIRQPVYDPEVVQMVRPGARDARLEQLDQVIRRQFPIAQGEHYIDVYEFWGDLPDPTTGVTLYRNILATFVDRRWCVRMPESNPFFDGTSALLWLRPRLQPNQIYGRGIIANGIKLQHEVDRMVRAFQDKTHLSISMLEADVNAARNPEMFKGGKIEIFPGKVFQRKSGADRKIFSRVDGPDPVNEHEVNLLALTLSQLQNTYGVSEWSSATEESADGRRRTKYEAQVKSANAQQPFNECAQYIERTGLSPFINKVWALMVQYEDQWDSPALLAKFADNQADVQLLVTLAQLSAEERWNVLKLDTELKVTGITLDITRQQVLARLQQFLALLQADPVFGPYVNRGFILRQYRVLLNMPPQVLIQGWQKAWQAQEAAVMAQLQGGGVPGEPGQPAQPSGMSATPGTPAQQSTGENQNNTQVGALAAARGAV